MRPSVVKSRVDATLTQGVTTVYKDGNNLDVIGADFATTAGTKYKLTVKMAHKGSLIFNTGERRLNQRDVSQAVFEFEAGSGTSTTLRLYPTHEKVPFTQKVTALTLEKK